MGFPKKWKHLIEKDPVVVIPDYVVLTYAVCACFRSSCGWGGWVIEALFKKNKKKTKESATGDKVLPADDDCKCPRCGKALFRTGVSYYMDRARSQKSRVVWHKKYKTVPLTFSK